MNAIQKLIESGVLKRVKRFRREVLCFGVSKPPDKPNVPGSEIYQQNESCLHYTTPASLLEVRLTFDIGDEELSLSDKHQLSLLKARVIYSLCCLLENLEEEIDEY